MDAAALPRNTIRAAGALRKIDAVDSLGDCPDSYFAFKRVVSLPERADAAPSLAR